MNSQTKSQSIRKEKKMTTCPQCGKLHKAYFDKFVARPGWYVDCPEGYSHTRRRVLNPRYEK